MHVRFGSKADICTAPTHVRFTPNSDRKGEIPKKAVQLVIPERNLAASEAIAVSKR
jgi:hypothetical protein